MSVQRGDVVLARVPHVAGARGKKRPAVVIQANGYNATLRHVVVAEVTSNLRWIGDPACVFIDVATSDGQMTGLHRDGVISCLHLVTMSMDRISPPIGRLSPSVLARVNDALKVALELT